MSSAKIFVGEELPQYARYMSLQLIMDREKHQTLKKKVNNIIIKLYNLSILNPSDENVFIL